MKQLMLLAFPAFTLAGYSQVKIVNVDKGKTTIYKLIIKNMTESKPYGSATTEQRISTTGQYFIYHHSTFTRVKKIKEIPDLLGDKKNELGDYISSGKLSGKSDMDYAELVAYYNKLVE